MPPTDFCATDPDSLSQRAALLRLPGAGVRSLCRLLGRWLDWYGSRHLATKHRRDLARLDDFMLKDIGLSRADVEGEIEKPFWRL